MPGKAKRPRKKTSHYRTASTVDKSNVEELDPCVKYVVDCWDKWDAHWSSKMNDFDRYYDRWIGKPPKRDEEWQANFHKKLTWQAEKALVARFHSTLFPTSAPIDYDTTETPDELQGILGKSIVGHWFKIGMFPKEFLSGMKSSSIYGSGLFEDDWYVKKEEIYEKVEQDIPDYRPMVNETGENVYDGDGNVQVMKVGSRKAFRDNTKMAVVEDRYRIRKANIFAWRIHPKKLNDDDNYPVIKQEFINYDDLLEREAEAAKYGFTGFENMKKIEEDRFKVEKGDLTRHYKDGEFEDKKAPQLEILHYWGPYAEDGGARKPMWIMVVNRKYKLKSTANPYWHKKPPLFHINWTEDEKPSYYGIGIPQMGESAEDRANTIVNTRTDERKKNVKGGGWYNARDPELDKTQLHKNVPGLMKKCVDVNNIVRPDPIIPSTPDDYKEEEMAVNDHREITGATNSLLPTADEKQQHDTLGGMQLLVNQASQRLKPDLSMMELMGIRKAANRAFLLTRQFLSEPKAIELIASEDQKKKLQLGKIYKLTPEQIRGKVSFYCTGLSETIEKAQNIDKLMKLAEVTGKIPAMAAITNYQNILRKIVLFLGFEDIEEFVAMNPVNPMQPVQQPPQPAMMQPGIGPPGVPQGIPPGMPGLPPQPQGLPPGGLPPQLLAMIAQSMKR